MRFRVNAVALSLMALGAILAFAVQGHPSWLNIQLVGGILLIIGLAALFVPRDRPGWLHRRIMIGRDRSGHRVVDRIDEQEYPPHYVESGTDTVVTRVDEVVDQFEDNAEAGRNTLE